MEKKKGGILSLVILALGLIWTAAGFFWLIASLIMLLCGLELNPIVWIIAGAAFVIGATLSTILLIKGKKQKTE